MRRRSRRAPGWEIKPEGACKGEVCVPLGGGPFDLLATAERLGMAVVHDASAGLWSLGPETLGGRSLATAEAPELVLPDVHTGEQFRLSSLRGPEGGDRLLGALLRLPLRPARVAGTAQRAAPPRARGRHRRSRDGRRRRRAPLHRGGPRRAPVARRRDAPDGRALRRHQHPAGDLDRRGRDHRAPARARLAGPRSRPTTRFAQDDLRVHAPRPARDPRVVRRPHPRLGRARAPTASGPSRPTR